MQSANNPLIRQFIVPDQYDFIHAHKDLESGAWKSVSPETIMEFSGVAYFFAKELYDKYEVPIGLVNSALGGSPVEAWMSEEALQQFPHAYQEMERFKDSLLIDSIQKSGPITATGMAKFVKQ